MALPKLRPIRRLAQEIISIADNIDKTETSQEIAQLDKARLALQRKHLIYNLMLMEVTCHNYIKAYDMEMDSTTQEME